jgi:N-acetylgalactosamine 4-sulfate 6-O-sulfotransferase
MGLNERSLDSSTMNSVATNLSLFLNALQYVIPHNFSDSYQSPCWHSQLFLPHRLEGLGRFLKKKTNERSDQAARSRFYNQIFVSTPKGTSNTLLCLPAFFLAGFPKCGTTTLHAMLYKHPMIAKPSRKEPHWWTRMPLNNMNEMHLRLAVIFYLQNFNVGGSGQVLTYDATTSTLWDSNFLADNRDFCAMPAAISHILPHTKFIVMMRDPVSRTFSNFLFDCTLFFSTNIAKWPQHDPSNVTVWFHQQVVKEVAYFNQCMSSNRSVFECASDKQFRRIQKRCHTIGVRLVVSIYYIHLLKWLQFFPKEQFLFLRMEDMSNNQTFMKKISDFLNIDRWKPNQFGMIENKIKVHVTMLPETRQILSDFFRPFNQQLVKLTGDTRFLW